MSKLPYLIEMVDTPPKPKVITPITEVGVSNTVEPVKPPQKQISPGYEQICNICPFKDFYMEFKRVVNMGDELNTRANIIDALAKKLEELNKS